MVRSRCGADVHLAQKPASAARRAWAAPLALSSRTLPCWRPDMRTACCPGLQRYLVCNKSLNTSWSADEDRKLPMIVAILPMLRRGVGMHHSGGWAGGRTGGRVDECGLALVQGWLACTCCVRTSPSMNPCWHCIACWRRHARCSARNAHQLRRAAGPPPPGHPAHVCRPTCAALRLPPWRAGLLPILKEVIEILFQEGLIKVGR